MCADQPNPEYLTLTAGVALPAFQAVVNGVFYGVAAGGLVAVAKSLEMLTVPPWAVGVTVGSLAGLYAWGNLLRDWRALLYGVEHFADPEHEIMNPEPVRIELASNDGRSMQFVDLPASPDQLIELGQSIAAGDSFSVARWSGAGGLFSRGEFERLRGELLKLGWLEWKSERDNARGVQVTRGGAAVFRHFASMSQTPTLSRRK